MTHCWYVSQTWGTHDHRWVSALADQGFEPTVLSLHRDSISIDDIKHEIRARDATTPILAGPLETVTKELCELPNPVIGLSWGFDLLELNSNNEDLSWLSALNHLIVDSASTRTIAETAGVDTARISTIPWGIDVEQFTPEGSRVELATFGITTHRPIVMSLRALEPLYRVEELIQSWPHVLAKRPEALLVIGHDGSLRAELADLVDGLGVATDAVFIGHVPESQLSELLRSVQVYVSTSPIDGTSVTLLQAMGCGTPVIVTDTSGNREWIDPGVTGRVYSSGAIADLADQVLNSLSDGDNSNAIMTANARTAVLARANWFENRRELGRILTSL